MSKESIYLEKQEKVMKTVREFISQDVTIEELSKQICISSSSIQRYLNDNKFIQECFGPDSPRIINLIHEKLNSNVVVGRSRGGTNSTINNVSIRDNSGHYSGIFKK